LRKCIIPRCKATSFITQIGLVGEYDPECRLYICVVQTRKEEQWWEKPKVGCC
jgi:hypothetical protein